MNCKHSQRTTSQYQEKGMWIELISCKICNKFLGKKQILDKDNPIDRITSYNQPGVG